MKSILLKFQSFLSYKRKTDNLGCHPAAQKQPFRYYQEALFSSKASKYHSQRCHIASKMCRMSFIKIAFETLDPVLWSICRNWKGDTYGHRLTTHHDGPTRCQTAVFLSLTVIATRLGHDMRLQTGWLWIYAENQYAYLRNSDGRTPLNTGHFAGRMHRHLYNSNTQTLTPGSSE